MQPNRSPSRCRGRRERQAGLRAQGVETADTRHAATVPLSYLCSTHNHLSTRGNQAEAIRLISEHVGIDTYLREGNIPDGYAEWKEKRREPLLLAQNAPSAPPLLTMATAQCDQGETSSARTAIRATPTPAPAVGQAADK